MSMLRYVRIHTLAPGVHPSNAPLGPSPSASKLYRSVTNWLNPLYAYAVPHRPPAETAAKTCHCGYPLYTFCSPTTSPFNDIPSCPIAAPCPSPETSAAPTAATTPGADEHACASPADGIAGMAPLSAPEPMSAERTDTRPVDGAASKDGNGSATHHHHHHDRRHLNDAEKSGMLIRASMEAVGRRKPSVTASAGPMAQSTTTTATTTTTTTTTTPTAAATPARRRRRSGFFSWGGAMGRTPTTAARPALPSNVIPNHPPAYRCEVCDYFQRLETAAAPALASTATPQPSSAATLTDRAAHATAGSSTSAGLSASTAPPAEAEEEVEEEEDEAEDVDDEWDSPPASTDIANTIMEDAEVAQLRFQDPFLVEVIGKVGLTRLANAFRKEFQAQLVRCQLTVAEMARRVNLIALHNTVHEGEYATWVERMRRDEREQRRARLAAPSEESVTASAEVVDVAAYTVRFAAAAYGLPFELGYFNSVSDMAKLQSEPHRRYTYATSEEQMESMRRMLQGEVPDPMLELATSHYSITPNRACYVVALDHKARRVIVAFRGSLTLADAICDIHEGYVQVDLTNPAEVVAVGVERGTLRDVQSLRPVTGASAAASASSTTSASSTRSGPENKTASASLSRALIRPRLYQQLVTPLEKLTAGRPKAACSEEPLLTRIPFGFYEAVTDAARTLIPSLRSIHAQYPHYELILTGHSLGGIEACVFHLLFCLPATTSTRSEPAWTTLFPRVQTITFGCAPVVEASAMPRLQAMLADEEARSGSRLVHFAYGLDVITRLQVRSIVDLLQPLASTDSKDNTSSGKAAEISAIHLPDEVMPTLATPGYLYSIPHTRYRSCYLVGTDEAWRKDLILTPESVFHHFPTFYVRSLNRLHRARQAGTHGAGKRSKGVTPAMAAASG